MNGEILETLSSPLGTSPRGPFEGKPWYWAFERDSADVKAIRAIYTGKGKASSVGLAFDNFSAYSAEKPTRPVPFEMESSIGLILIGGFVGYRKLKSQQRQARLPLDLK